MVVLMPLLVGGDERNAQGLSPRIPRTCCEEPVTHKPQWFMQPLCSGERMSCHLLIGLSSPPLGLRMHKHRHLSSDETNNYSLNIMIKTISIGTIPLSPPDIWRFDFRTCMQLWS